MPNGLGLSYVNHVDDLATVFTAGSATASLPGNNVADSIVGKPWQTSGTVDTYLEIDLGSSKTCQLFHLAGLQNFASTDTIRVMAHATKPTNIALYSQVLDNGYWTKSESSISANATAAPDGTTTADKLVENSATAVHGIYRSTISGLTDGLPYTISVFAKASERTSIYIRADDDSGGNEGSMNIVTGSGAMIGTPPSGCTIHATLYANGWTRVEFRFPDLNGTTIDNLTIGAGTGSYAGDGSSGVFLWGVQIEQSATADGYVATTDATRTDVPDWLASVDSATDLTDIDSDVATGYNIWTHIAPAAVSVRYVKFEINAASQTPTPGYFRVGRAWVGSLFNPGRGFSYGEFDLGWEDSSEIQLAFRSGAEYADSRPKRRICRFSLNLLTETEAKDTILEIQRSVGLSGQFVAIPEMASSRLNKEVILGRFQSVAPISLRSYPYWATVFEVRESL